MRKVEADGLRQIDVTLLKEKGFFSNGDWVTVTFNWAGDCYRAKGSAEVVHSTVNNDKYMRIRYGSAGETIDCEIPLVTTFCGSSGGVRYWFICPAEGCNRRVGTLYLGNGGFACRHCHNLTYASQNVSKKYRNMLKAYDAAIEELVRCEMAML